MPFVAREVTCHPGKKHAAFGLCVNCWARENRAGWPNGRPVATQQKMAACHPERPHLCKGLCSSCYKATQRGVRMDGYYKRTYGISEAEKLRMTEAQGGACRLCRRKKKLKVDHCHVTGKVRGLLCASCNMALGLLQDDVAVLAAAIEYLR